MNWIKVLLSILLLTIMVGVGYVMYIARFPQLVRDASVSGIQLHPQTWSGTITITGDTFFVPWVTLTITPGTKVQFKGNPEIPNTDWTIFANTYIKDHNDPTGRKGYNQSHFDLMGKIIALGTEKGPILFTSANVKPEYADWDQVVAFAGSQFDYVELAFSHNGLNVTNAANLFTRGAVRISHSKIHDSLWSCIDIYDQEVLVTDNEIFHCWHHGVGVKGADNVLVENNFIHDANLSVSCERGAEPQIRNNRFEAAPLHLLCPQVINNQVLQRKADTSGGTYNGVVIYPASAFP